jgi:hypothetical protein
MNRVFYIFPFLQKYTEYALRCSHPILSPTTTLFSSLFSQQCLIFFFSSGLFFKLFLLFTPTQQHPFPRTETPNPKNAVLLMSNIDPHLQAIRHVFNSSTDTPSTSSGTGEALPQASLVHVHTHIDPATQEEYVLWEDIQSSFNEARSL